METGSLNRNFFKTFLLLSFLILIVNCHTNSNETSDSDNTKTIKIGGEEYIEGELKSEFSPKDVQTIIDVVVDMLLPRATGKNLEALHELVNFLNDAKEKAPAYFEDPNNIINFCKQRMAIDLIAANLYPEDYDLNRIISSHYISTAGIISTWAQTDEERRLSDDYKKKGVRAAEELVEKFPDNGLSYAQLAYALYVTGGDKHKVADLYKRCLALDAKSAYCRQGYDMVRKELGEPER